MFPATYNQFKLSHISIHISGPKMEPFEANKMEVTTDNSHLYDCTKQNRTTRSKEKIIPRKKDPN